MLTCGLNVLTVYLKCWVACVCVQLLHNLQLPLGTNKVFEFIFILHLNGATFVRNMHFWNERQSCVCGLHPWKAAKSSLPDILLLTLVWWFWLKKQDKLAYWQFMNLTNRSLSSLWKNPTQPQQPGTSSSCCSTAWSHTAMGWHPTLPPAFVARQPMWLYW